MPNSPAQTITFSESSNARQTAPSFESFLSYHPEMMVTIGNLLIAFKDGQLYTHDSPTYNNFFGVQYDSYVNFVFNNFEMQRKTFQSVEEIANVVWECPEISTSLMSYGITPQQSNLIASDFDLLEGGYCASFLCDSNSVNGLINGDSLKGWYISVKFQANSPTTLVNLALVTVKTIDSAYNPK